MPNLNRCPCGRTPSKLHIVDNGAKWAYAYGHCCGEWHVEFRTMYNPITSPECMELAVEAWNAAEQNVHLTALRLGLALSLLFNVILLAVVLATIGGR